MNQNTIREKKNRAAGYLFPAVLFFCAVFLIFPAVCRRDSSAPKAAEGSEQISGTQTDPDTDHPVSVSKTTFSIDGLDRTYRLLLVSDLHIIVPGDPQVDPESADVADGLRRGNLHSSFGRHFLHSWTA